MAWRKLAGNMGYNFPLTYCEKCSHCSPIIDTDSCVHDQDEVEYHTISCAHADACLYIFDCVKSCQKGGTNDNS